MIYDISDEPASLSREISYLAKPASSPFHVSGQSYSVCRVWIKVLKSSLVVLVVSMVVV